MSAAPGTEMLCLLLKALAGKSHAVASSVTEGCPQGPHGLTLVGDVTLLGVPTMVLANICSAEHHRRRLSGYGALTDPVLLGRLVGLPLGLAVTDKVAWAVTAGQPSAVIDRRVDGITVTRRLAAPLSIDAVTLTSQRCTAR